MQTSAEKSGFRPTREQKRAICEKGRSLSIIAGAGSGKTFVLVERCVELLKNKRTRLENLLVITFTEKAAEELKSRLRERLPHLEPEMQRSYIGTIHAFCARVLREKAAEAGIDPSFTILDQSSAELLIHRTAKTVLLNMLDENDTHAALLVETWGFRNALACLEELLSFEWHAEAVKRLIPEAELMKDERTLIDAVFKCFDRCVKELKARRDESGTLDFQGLEIQMLNLLDREAGVRDDLQRHFHHILIDEFQDTNDIQLEIVKRLWRPGRNTLYIVGDPCQSIYRFRGANVNCFLDISNEVSKSGGDVIYLNRNFRSRPQIITGINNILTHIFCGESRIQYTPLQKSREDTEDNSFKVIKFEATAPLNATELRKKEAAVAVSKVREMIRSGLKYSDIACLFQSLKHVEIYEDAFRRAGIPFRTSGGSGFLERQEVTDIVNALKLASMLVCNRINNSILYAVLRSPLVGLSDDECYNLRFKPLPDSGERSAERFIDAVMESPAGDFLNFLKETAPLSSVSDLIRRIIDKTGFDVISSALDPSGQSEANLEKLIQMAKNLERQEYALLDDFIDYIDDLKRRGSKVGDSPSQRGGDDAVQIMTVHAAKGLEFPAVILLDTIHGGHRNTKRWCFVRGRGFAVQPPDEDDPLNKGKKTRYFEKVSEEEQEEDTSERKRLLYVAMTRAMEKLVIPLHPAYKGGLWNKWLSEIEFEEKYIEFPEKKIELETAKPDDRMRLVERPPIGRFKSKSSELTVTEIEAYARCPYEYMLRQVYKVPAAPLWKESEEEIPANVLGDIVHTVIERLNNDPSTDIGRALEAGLKDRLIMDTDGRNRRCLEKILKRYLEWSQENLYSEKYAEYPFVLQLMGFVIRGKIDLLGKRDGAFEIVDFKTDKITSSEELKSEAEKYRVQMMVYALAASCALKKQVDRAFLCFLNTNMDRAFPFEIEIPPLPVLDEKIRGILKKIESGDFKVKDKERPCKRCPYHKNRTCSFDEA